MSIALKTAALAALALTSAASAAAITPGNLVVYRVGDGSAALTNAGTAVFIDEYSVTGTLVQSIALPNAAGSAALVASGTATSEGLISASPDGKFVAVPGYNAAAGTAGVAGSTSANVNRAVGVLSTATGTLSSVTSFSDSTYTANNIRSALTVDGTTVYAGGNATSPNGGVRQATAGGSTSAIINTTANVRGLGAADGAVYFSTGSGTTGIYQVTGTPATPGQAATPIAAATSPYGFVFLDLSTAVAGVDTLYVADDGSAANGGGIKKYTLSSTGGTWAAAGTFTAAGVRGLAASVAINGSVNLFGTTGASGAANSSLIYAIADTSGFGGTATGTAATLVTGATNTAFRGVAFIAAPPVVPEPASLALVGIGGLVALRRRRAM